MKKMILDLDMGFNPYIMEQNQFTGAYLSVVESLSKLVAAGFEHEKAYLSFQEYSPVGMTGALPSSVKHGQY